MTELDLIRPANTESPVAKTRTLADVANTDFFATVLLLRERYIHHFKPNEFEKVVNTLGWLEKPKNLALFEKANLNPNEIKYLPEDVQFSRLTVNLFFELGLEAKHGANVKIYKEPVAFAPNTKEFKPELFAITHKLFEKLKGYDPQEGNVKIEKENDKETLKMISDFYKTGGHEYRNEATDAISAILFRQYWNLLKESAVINTASGKLLG